MKYKLRDYQQIGVDSLRASYRRGFKAPLYHCPTGGGKTIVFCHIAESAAAKGRRVMIVVHRRELLDQASDKLSELGVRHGLIAANRIMTAELVQVASVNTLIRRLARVPEPDMIIIDEGHHCVKGNQWGRVIEHFSNSFILGVTATPIRTNGFGLGVNYHGYYDTLVKGPSVRWLIDQGYLSEPIVYAPPINFDLKGVRTRGGDYASGDLEEKINKSTITGDVVQHYRDICPGVPAIAFCVSIKHAEDLAARFNAVGIEAANLDGTMRTAVRDQRIRDLGSGRIKILTSCEIISEGTDIPVVTVAILLRPTQSLGLFLQQCGRVLRPFPGKKNAIILDHVNNTSRHGLIDQEREWSLASIEKRKIKKGDEEAISPVRQCRQCFAVYPPSRSACPQCGALWVAEARDIKQVEGKLKALTPEQMKEIAAKKAKRREVGRAETLEALQAIGAARGYKPGWAEHIYRSRKNRKPKPHRATFF